MTKTCKERTTTQTPVSIKNEPRMGRLVPNSYVSQNSNLELGTKAKNISAKYEQTGRLITGI